MISRIWHGWTAPANADTYEALLKKEIFTGIERREIEFVTIMWFDSLDTVKAFAGEDYETAVVPPSAQALLARFDSHSQHYEVEAAP